MSKGKFLVPWRAADLKTNRNDTHCAFKDLNLNTHKSKPEDEQNKGICISSTYRAALMERYKSTRHADENL